VDASGTYRGTLRSTGLRPRFLERLTDRGIQIPLETFKLEEAGRWSG